MNILCEREKLREALNVVCSVIPTKSTRPAVENVYLVAKEDYLELVGTDLDVAVRYRIDEVKVQEPGSALIPARVASDFVRDLNGEIVTLSGSRESEAANAAGSPLMVISSVRPSRSTVARSGADSLFTRRSMNCWTVTTAVPLIAPDVAVTVAVPWATDVTNPAVVTEATASSSDSQENEAPEIALPFASSTDAASC